MQNTFQWKAYKAENADHLKIQHNQLKLIIQIQRLNKLIATKADRSRYNLPNMRKTKKQQLEILRRTVYRGLDLTRLRSQFDIMIYS